MRLDGVRVLAVPERDRDRHAHLGDPCQRLQHVEVSLDERRLGDDAHRVPVLGADLQAPAREPVTRLERLVAVGHPGEDDQLALPARALERLAQQPRRLGLHGDLAIEVGPGTEPEVFVRRTGIAIVADDAVRDEVSRSRRDVVHGHLDAQRIDGGDLQARGGSDRQSFDPA